MSSTAIPDSSQHSNLAPAPALPAEDPVGTLPGLVPPTRGRSQRSIGDVIIDLGFASRVAVEEATAKALEQGTTAGQVLIASGDLNQDQLARALAERHGIDFIDLSVFEIDMRVVNLINFEAAKRYQALPVAVLADRTLLLAMADPTNVIALDEISMITGMKLRRAVAEPDDIGALIGRLKPVRGTQIEIEEPEPELTVPPAVDEGSSTDAPIVRLVDSILALAVDRGASDVHCDPEPHEMQVLFRIDGILTPAATISRADAGSVISRIKIMAGLNIAERRVPQDGRMALTIDRRRIDVRVVTLPLIHGEGVVMRILDSTGTTARSGIAGHAAPRARAFVAAVSKPYGPCWSPARPVRANRRRSTER